MLSYDESNPAGHPTIRAQLEEFKVAASSVPQATFDYLTGSNGYLRACLKRIWLQTALRSRAVGKACGP